MSDIDSLVSACHRNDVKTVTVLVTMVNINQRSSEGEPPLYKAMRYNNHEIVKILLARPEILLDTTDTLYSWTGLHAACFCSNVQCVQLFLASHHCTKDMVKGCRTGMGRLLRWWQPRPGTMSVPAWSGTTWLLLNRREYTTGYAGSTLNQPGLHCLSYLMLLR